MKISEMFNRMHEFITGGKIKTGEAKSQASVAKPAPTHKNGKPIHFYHDAAPKGPHDAKMNDDRSMKDDRSMLNHKR